MTSIPDIHPVADPQRPLLSVMIPTYNCAEYLRVTLQSVLLQDLGPAQMQIEVVDDASTLDDPQGVVNELAPGRVEFFRQLQNAGVTANFNTCLQRSRGLWVHVLHGDDYVLPGFYELVQRCIAEYPDAGAVITRAIHVDDAGSTLLEEGLLRDRAGILRDWLPQLFSYNPVRTPSIVVRREAYERLGGFDERLRHCTDWDMWKRVATNYPVVYDPALVAAYRLHGESDTLQLFATGRTFHEFLMSMKLSRKYLADDQVRPVLLPAFHHLTSVLSGELKRRISLRDWRAARASLRPLVESAAQYVLYRSHVLR